MKQYIRLIALALIVVLIFTPVANASELPQQKASYYFSMTGIDIVKVSSTQFRVWFDVTATHTMKQVGASKIVVERSSNQTDWTVIKTYRSESYSSMLYSNTVGHTSYITHSGTPGYYYRAEVTFYAKDSSGTGTYAYYSDTFYLS